MDIQTSSDAILPPLMRAGGEVSPEAAAALCRHPSFAQAMRAVLTDNVSLYRGNRILNYVGYDRGRLVVAMLAFYLHASRRPGDPNVRVDGPEPEVAVRRAGRVQPRPRPGDAVAAAPVRLYRGGAGR